MPEIFGDFVEIGEAHEYLVINFSPNSMPIQQRWRNNGLSADFLADYWGTFFPDEGHSTQNRQAEIKSAVSYIANELLENAMKFSNHKSNHAISIGLYLFRESLIFYSTNSLKPKNIEQFKGFIRQLLTEDLDELYIRQLESNADNEDGLSSLGFLTMLNDYEARLAWKFETVQQDPKIVTVTTMATLPV
ncbi:DUF6272 family protein [Desulfococcaceae bacterium HSG8]|nr:DUF6272 family protein [Desulfococcaceae bacterium HSG8]